MSQLRKNLSRKLARHREIPDILRERGFVSVDQLELAAKDPQLQEEALVDALVALGFLNEWDLAKCVTETFQLPFLDLTTYEIPPQVEDLLPRPFLHQHLVVPVDAFGRTLALATTGGITPGVLEEIEDVAGLDVAPYVALTSAIRRTLQERFPLAGVAEEVSARFDQLFEPG